MSHCTKTSFLTTPHYICAHRNSDNLHNVDFIGYSLVGEWRMNTLLLSNIRPYIGRRRGVMLKIFFGKAFNISYLFFVTTILPLFVPLYLISRVAILVFQPLGKIPTNNIVHPADCSWCISYRLVCFMYHSNAMQSQHNRGLRIIPLQLRQSNETHFGLLNSGSVCQENLPKSLAIRVSIFFSASI